MALSPPSSDSAHKAYRAASEPRPAEPTVTCFVSGRVVPESEAVLVRIGPGIREWMLPEYCKD